MFFLQQRYQDSGWETVNGPEYRFDFREDAERKADELMRDPICWGMVRVIDTNELLRSFRPRQPSPMVQLQVRRRSLLERLLDLIPDWI